MRKSDVKIGAVYVVKVSGRLAQVQVVSCCGFGGWYGRNVQTGRQVRIRTAGRLRLEVIAPMPKLPRPDLAAHAREMPGDYQRGYADAGAFLAEQDAPYGDAEIVRDLEE